MNEASNGLVANCFLTFIMFPVCPVTQQLEASSPPRRHLHLSGRFFKRWA
jgi:hypothetical protein